MTLKIGKNSIDNIYSLSGDLKAPSGQAIITTENREKNVLIIYAEGRGLLALKNRAKTWP